MKRYLLNKLNKINETLQRQYTEPIKILCVYDENGLIISNLLSDNEKIENESFKTEQELQQYIQERNIQNIIRNLCIDKI